MIFEGENYIRGRNVTVRPVRILAPYSSVGSGPDKKLIHVVRVRRPLPDYVSYLH